MLEGILVGNASLDSSLSSRKVYMFCMAKDIEQIHVNFILLSLPFL